MPSSKMPTSEIPSGDQALALERLSRHQGSGITAEQLLGRWRLQLLWRKGKAQPNPATAALLRGPAGKFEHRHSRRHYRCPFYANG